MSSYTTAESIVTISGNPEVYLTETTLVIKDKEISREVIRGCRVEEMASFLETDLFFTNENGPGKIAFKSLKWLLSIVGTLNFIQDFTSDFTSKDETDGYTGPEQSPAASMDANPPLFCLSLLTGDDEIQILPTINRLLLLDLAAKINRELGF